MEIATVIIADDHVIFRKGLRTVLNDITFIKVIGEVSNGNELLKALQKEKADIVFMDINMPEMDGFIATQKVKEKYADVAVIALTMHEEIGYFNKMLEAGADAFLLKKTTKDELENAIKAVMQNQTYFSQEFSSTIQHLPTVKSKIDLDFTKRELEILALICKGYSNNEMADLLNISRKTVDGHRTKLMEKAGAKNSANLVMFAVKHGLVNPGK